MQNVLIWNNLQQRLQFALDLEKVHVKKKEKKSDFEFKCRACSVNSSYS